MRALAPALAALSVLLVLPPAAQAARAQNQPPAPAGRQGGSSAGDTGKGGNSGNGGLALRDRIVAVVDEDPILDSDIDRIIGLGLAAAEPGQSERELRRQVLEQLIDQRLRFHEIDRFGFGQVPVEAIEEQVAGVRARFASEEELERQLREVGLSMTSLRQLLARQLMVKTYVEERLGPRVFVTREDIETYYRGVLGPEMQRRGQPLPPLPEVREQIRSLIKEQRLNEEIEKWTDELRQKADVGNFFDSKTGAPLPPVVRRVDRPATPGDSGNP